MPSLALNVGIVTVELITGAGIEKCRLTARWGEGQGLLPIYALCKQCVMRLRITLVVEFHFSQLQYFTLPSLSWCDHGSSILVFTAEFYGEWSAAMSCCIAKH